MKLRLGNAGANTAADPLDLLVQTVAQAPTKHRRHLLIRGDSAAAIHAVLDWLTLQDGKCGRRVEYSFGWSIGEAERAAITGLPPRPGRRRSTPTVVCATAPPSPS
ncbi:hypothetical protein [Micromonospora sp. NPDC005367]|uniref:hypothetical protein n=1 Tax=Micromonospora sp. NPDC005367 TaxID=3155590 RepID=UPI0033AFD65B